MDTRFIETNHGGVCTELPGMTACECYMIYRTLIRIANTHVQIQGSQTTTSMTELTNFSLECNMLEGEAYRKCILKLLCTSVSTNTSTG